MCKCEPPEALPFRTRGYIRRQDSERLSAVAAAPSGYSAKKNRTRRPNQSRRVELSCTHLVSQLHPELPHAARLVGAEVLFRKVKALDVTHHDQIQRGMNCVQKTCCSRRWWFDSESNRKTWRVFISNPMASCLRKVLLKSGPKCDIRNTRQ